MSNQATIKRLSLWVALGACGVIGGCATTEPPTGTLADLDRPLDKATAQPVVALGGQSDQDARDAYYRYIQSAPQDDSGRNLALARLADLELAQSDALVNQDDYQEDQRYRDTLERTVELLRTALEEFPDAEGNDRKLYQLAKSYDELGQAEQAQTMLEQLTHEHPDSEFYPEAQFRLAENAFSRGDYMQAEVAYTAALFSSQDTGFHERALFKRGWARYKQSLFADALEDFMAVIHAQDFTRREAVEPKSQVVYDEYFRSLGLTMINSPGQDQLPTQLKQHGMNDLFPAYRATSTILQKQGRTSDAVAQWQTFLQAEPNGWSAMAAHAQVVSLWRSGGFEQRALEATRQLHSAYSEQAGQLAQEGDERIELTREQLRDQWKAAAQYHHAHFQKDGETEAFRQAQTWYQRYLKHFDGFAQKDGIALAFGDLLAEAERTEAAFEQYERAAFDGELILNPEAAYAAIALLHELIEQSPDDARLDRYIRYTRAFVRLYPTDERIPEMALGAAQRSFHRERYEAAVEFAQATLRQAEGATRVEAQQLLLQSHLNNGAHRQAEQAAMRLLALEELPASAEPQARELLALSIFRQAETAEQAEEWDSAIEHYRRIHELAPEAENAASGLYNALSLAAEHEHWPRAIALMERFQQQYPAHRLQADVERRLSQAYIATGQTDQAARQYEQLAQSEQDDKAQRAAQWKAAELYEERGDIEQAINAYRHYAHSYPQPYPQNAEAMHKLIGFYGQTEEADKRQFWERKLLQTENAKSDSEGTERTSRLAAGAALSLGLAHFDNFEQTRLSLPLNQSLARKTEHMQNAVQHFATAASFGFAEVASEATHRIGRIYETLAQDLLDSDRPPELSSEERMQYDILLEDRAFPFEDKAIEFYERNLTRARNEGFNQWMVQSRARLEQLFPVRYSRKPKAGFQADDDRLSQVMQRPPASAQQE